MWPMYEFWSDTAAEPMKVIDAFIMPLLKDALAKKSAKGQSEKKAEDDDEETLLEHLVNLTDGQ